MGADKFKVGDRVWISRFSLPQQMAAVPGVVIHVKENRYDVRAIDGWTSVGVDEHDLSPYFREVFNPDERE